MKKIYLHIGTHKTGTTAVQSFAKQHIDEIAKKGILYPKTGIPFLNEMNTGQHLLPWTQVNKISMPHRWGKYLDDKARLWFDLREEVLNSSCNTVLISSEEFDVLTDEGVAYVADQLKEFDVTILCYLRRLDEFVETYYSTAILHYAEKRDINTFYKGMCTTTDYFELINRWRTYFGEPRVKVLFYHRSALKNEDIVVDVFDNMGFDVADLRSEADSKLVNTTGFPWYAIEMIRTLNKLSVPRETIMIFINIIRKVCKNKNYKHCSILDLNMKNRLINDGIISIKKINVPSFTSELEFAFSKIQDDTLDSIAQDLNCEHDAIKKCFEDILIQLRSAS
jgi:hypothetical protein